MDRDDDDDSGKPIWEYEEPFDGQLCQEYLCQKSSKSVRPNPFKKLQSN